MTNEKKIFKVKGVKDVKFSDEEIVELIKKGKIKPDNFIATNEMGMWIRVKDSIYQYYINEDKGE